MKVSVVICTYSPDLYDDFCEAVESVLEQDYDTVEVVAVIDGSDSVGERVRRDWDDHDSVAIVENDETIGLSASRNRGSEEATGDVIAFMDDDAVAAEGWVQELVRTYTETDVEAVGGKMLPLWVAEEPWFLPAEFYWLVGVTHRGFPAEGPVRNTFGSNISFRATVLEELDGFDETLGRKGSGQVQGEETELASRVRQELDGTLYYTPDAAVYHKVFSYRTQPLWLGKRAFWQGYSKSVMEQRLSEPSPTESAFLRQLLFSFVPSRLRGLVSDPSRSSLAQLLMLFVLTGLVGFGYLYGTARRFLQSEA
ncbi:glycosyltransferase [Halovivax cerinus]|uniref:Glycosyltransferase n=1 Tax=Halovivax cerinus TaxID=1487865 RepID=A0ABD5NK73_9EURY|nr:glycosyltransferase [Halovivax cerinus]